MNDIERQTVNKIIRIISEEKRRLRKDLLSVINKRIKHFDNSNDIGDFMQFKFWNNERKLIIIEINKLKKMQMKILNKFMLELKK